MSGLAQPATVRTLDFSGDQCGDKAHRWGLHASAYRLANAATERRACAVAALFQLQHTASSCLRMGMGQFFRMVEQSQEHQLAMPLMCPSALLFRGWLSASKWSRAAWRSRRVASHSRKLASPGVLASLRVHFA